MAGKYSGALIAFTFFLFFNLTFFQPIYAIEEYTNPPLTCLDLLNVGDGLTTPIALQVVRRGPSQELLITNYGQGSDPFSSRVTHDFGTHILDLKHLRGPLLEVGSGEGTLLSTLLDEGVEAWGIELSPPEQFYRLARQRPQLRDRLLVGDFLEAGFNGNPFNTIFFMASLFSYETSPDLLLATMEHAHKHLNTGGHIYITPIPEPNRAFFDTTFKNGRYLDLTLLHFELTTSQYGNGTPLYFAIIRKD